jgi:hypothetical protein
VTFQLFFFGPILDNPRAVIKSTLISGTSDLKKLQKEKDKTPPKTPPHAHMSVMIET